MWPSTEKTRRRSFGAIAIAAAADMGSSCFCSSDSPDLCTVRRRPMQSKDKKHSFLFRLFLFLIKLCFK